jgi:AGCS family alanine or glycine:cation symporter
LGHASVGKFYAFLICLAAFGVGCTTQSNAVSRTTLASFGVPSRISGFLLAVLAGFVILGGIRSISSLCVRIVPFLAVLFTGSCLLLLWINRAVLPEALLLILNSAFTGKAVTGGLTGSSLLLTIRYGIARGLFTNEAGIGTAAIPAAASSSTSCSRQAYVSMTAVFWDTVVMCLLSGLVIITNMLAHPSSLEGVSADGLTEAAFSFLPFFGSRFLSLCLIAFAITTLIGWSYLGECAMDFLAGNKGLFLYRTLYIVMIYVGAVLPLSFVWECTDLINALMVLPNVCALFLLHKYIEA